MDIDEIRRQNILLLESEFGSATATAEAVGMSYVQYLNLRDGAKDARSGKCRGMRKETAWRFENAGKKERGWLDQDHSSDRLNAQDQQITDRIKEEFLTRDIPEHIKQTILTLLTSSPEKKK